MAEDDLAEMRLDGRAAIITGGAGGFGRAIATLLGRRGASVLLVDVSKDGLSEVVRELSGCDVTALSLAGDVSDWEVARRAVEVCKGEWGRVDILVNNAGIGGQQLPLWEIPLNDWRRVMAVNLDAVFQFCRAAVPAMLENGWGRIVNISSIAGKEGNPRNSQYSASKAAVIGLTKSLAKEVATQRILVNAITPGQFKTPLLQTEGMDPELLAQFRAKMPMQRMGEPVELARLVGFLVSEQMSFSTGTVFDISGGRATY